MTEKRWPPVYDLETLLAQIERLSCCKRFPDEFFSDDRSLDFCQGDVISLESDFPFIDQDGSISILCNEDNLWVFVGNTCDFSKKTGDFKYTQVSPLVRVPDDTPAEMLRGFLGYSTFKRFFFPEWDTGRSAKGFFLDFSRLCTIEKDGMKAKAKVLARLEMHSWLLFHSCLVRYLARDDGRNDPG